MPDVLVSEDIRGPGIDELSQRFDVCIEPDLWRERPALQKKLGDPSLRGLIVRNQTRVDKELIDAMAGVKVIGRAGAGLDNIDVPAASTKGISVVATPDQNSVSVAELAIGMLLMLARKLAIANQDTHQGNWNRKRYVGTELYGKTLGIVGFGRIGFLVAMRGRAFGMDVLIHDAYVSPDAATVAEVRGKLVSLDELLQHSDFVSCHLPSTPQTRGLFNKDHFKQMKPSALLINTSRGDVIDEAALTDALIEKHIGGAALDVRTEEPPTSGRLNELDNVILTPHIAAFTEEAQQRVVEAVCRDVSAVLLGAHPCNLVNQAVLQNA